MANDLNSVTLIGRLTRDVELRYTNGGMAIGTLSIAVNRSVKKNDSWVDEVSYFEVSAFGKMIENLQPYLGKGKQIAVEGSLKQDRWEKEGMKYSKVTVVAYGIHLLGGRSDGNSEGTGNTIVQQATNVRDDFPEDIPFGEEPTF